MTNTASVTCVKEHAARQLRILDSDRATLRHNLEDAAIMSQNGWISPGTYSRALSFLAQQRVCVEVRRRMLCDRYPRRLFYTLKYLLLCRRMVKLPPAHIAYGLLPTFLFDHVRRLNRVLRKEPCRFR